MRACLLSLLLLPLLACAQSWCPPGATWTYHSDLITFGFQRLTYNRDTLIDGFTAQVIDRYSISQYPQPDPPFWSEPYEGYTDTRHITRLEDDVVYIRQSSSWDTLYWYGANIGDHWYPPHVTDPECAPLVVSDTGTTYVGGMALRFVELNWALSVYERIGSTHDMMLDCPNLINDGPVGMRCYSDQDISVNFTGLGCETLVGINDHAATSRTSVFPNPGTTHFTLALPPGPHTITLFDATGRMALQQRTTDARPVIATETLPAGLYRIAVRNEQGAVMGATWVKER